MQSKNKTIISIFIIVVVLILSYVGFHSLGAEKISDYIMSLGYLGSVLYIIIMALTIILSPIPSIPLAVASGALYGGFLGGLYTVIGATIGAIVAFELSRILGRPFFRKNYPGIIEFCSTRYKFSLPWIIFFTRLLPVFQFDIVSYAAGLCQIKRWKFMLATITGMIPVTFILTYTGKIFMVNMVLSIVLTIVIILSMYLIPKHFLRINK